MAGTATYTTRKLQNNDGISVINVTWTSDSNGDVSVAGLDFDGEVLQLDTNPDGVPDVPTDQYDITVTNLDGIDVLAGDAGNRSDTNSESVVIVVANALHPFTHGPHTFVVANAGNANKGVARIFIRGEASGAIKAN